MKNKFRFKSLILSLIMVATPILGVASQRPFVVNAALVVEGSKNYRVKKPGSQVLYNNLNTLKKKPELRTIGIYLIKNLIIILF